MLPSTAQYIPCALADRLDCKLQILKRFPGFPPDSILPDHCTTLGLATQTWRQTHTSEVMQLVLLHVALLLPSLLPCYDSA